MTFSVQRSDGETSDYPDDTKFRVHENGVLQMIARGERVYLAPHAWTRITQQVDPNRSVDLV